jgi:hypothetical protein
MDMHLDAGTIHAWLDGALPADESARVEAHAKECAECGALVAEARGFIAGASRIVSSLDVVRGNVIPAPSPVATTSKRSLWRKLKLTPARAAIAATILVGVASMFTVQRSQFETAAPQADKVSAAPAAALPAAASPAAAPAPAQPTTDTVRPPLTVKNPTARDAAVGAAKPALRADRLEVATPAPPTAQAAPISAAPTAPSADRRLRLDELVVPQTVTPLPAPTGRQMSAAKSASNAAGVAGAAGAAAPVVAAENAPMRRMVPANAFASVAQAEGCYQLTIDRTNAPPEVPDRFRLQRDSSGTNVVRIQTLHGDSVLSGATWTTPTGGSVLVSFADANARRVELSFSTSRPMAALTFGGRTLDATIQRNACER